MPIVRAVVQRVTEAAVAVDGLVIAQINNGVLVLLGVGLDDTTSDAEALAEKIASLRIFADERGAMNRSLLEVDGEALVVSQFTLLADVRKGRRPSLAKAAPSSQAEPLVAEFMERLGQSGIPVNGGRFGAHMAVSLTNDGPVTILMESAEGRLV